MILSTLKNVILLESKLFIQVCLVCYFETLVTFNIDS